MIYHAFAKLNIGDIINIDHSTFLVTAVKVFGVIKTLTMYEYQLKEVLK